MGSVLWRYFMASISTLYKQIRFGSSLLRQVLEGKVNFEGSWRLPSRRCCCGRWGILLGAERFRCFCWRFGGF